MKRILGMTGCILSVAMLVGCGEEQEVASGQNLRTTPPVLMEVLNTPLTQEQGTQLVVMDVEGMTCAGCEDAVRTAITSVEGVKKASVSHKAKKAWVQVDDQSSLATDTLVTTVTELAGGSRYTVTLQEN